MVFVLLHSCKGNVRSIFKYNANLSLNYAIKTYQKNLDYIHRLEDFPYIGRYVPEILDNRYRERIYKDYRIIYFIHERLNTIFFQLVFNARQDFKSFYKLRKKDLLINF